MCLSDWIISDYIHWWWCLSLLLLLPSTPCLFAHNTYIIDQAATNQPKLSSKTAKFSFMATLECVVLNACEFPVWPMIPPQSNSALMLLLHYVVSRLLFATLYEYDRPPVWWRGDEPSECEEEKDRTTNRDNTSEWMDRTLERHRETDCIPILFTLLNICTWISLQLGHSVSRQRPAHSANNNNNHHNSPQTDILCHLVTSLNYIIGRYSTSCCCSTLHKTTNEHPQIATTELSPSMHRSLNDDARVECRSLLVS